MNLLESLADMSHIVEYDLSQINIFDAVNFLVQTRLIYSSSQADDIL